ncbi:LamG-like jellyroll fold domain-containing protein [Haloferula chungangensis]|uniref:LamG-like jellyroll fold domain-containing protein n=1 Tax=Haloferula chungangensis TaxID=1048331 RepID=A0ABW2LAZ8_9BACT
MTEGEFEAKVSRYLDGELSPRDFAELEKYLESSEEARASYLDQIDLHNVLDLELSTPAMVYPGVSNVVPIERMMKRQKRRAFIQSAMVAAAMLVLLGILFQLVVVPKKEPPLVFRASRDSIVSVTHPAAYEDGREPEADTLVEGSRLELRQGVVELNLSSGVMAIVRAPADLTLLGKNRMSVREGVAWFHVPEEAIGFRVSTPRMDVTDLGTEFGVICAPETLDEVHLLKGKIEVRHRHGVKNVEALEVPTGLIADPAGRFRSIPARAEDFLTYLPPSLPYLHLSFDSIDDGRLDVTGTHPSVPDIKARLLKPAGDPPLTPGVHGQALRLYGRGDFVRTNWPGISGNRPRTVALWVRMDGSEAYNPAVPLVGWGSLLNNGKWKIHAVDDVEAGGRVARISLGKSWYSTNNIRIDDGQWHHLVAVSYGESLENGRPALAIFVDGQRRELIHHGGSQGNDRFSDLYTLTDAKDSVPLLVGKGILAGNQSFKGELDELTVYEGALSDESIRHLAAGELPDSGK